MLDCDVMGSNDGESGGVSPGGGLVFNLTNSNEDTTHLFGSNDRHPHLSFTSIRRT